MQIERRFETLRLAEIRHLMTLVVEAGVRGTGFNPSLPTAYGQLAAELAFELWSRQQAQPRVWAH
jgi:hypothetical protein